MSTMEEENTDPSASDKPQPGGGGGEGGGGGSDSILGRKLKKILESDLETDSETAQALEELSTFFTENSLHARRFLRGQIERRSLQINQDFLKDLSEVVEAVEDVHNVVGSMKSNCADMKRTLEATKTKTRDLIQQTNRLQEEGAILAVQSKQLDNFVAKYQLTEAEEKLLGTGDVGPDFYAALERSRLIEADCRKLLELRNLSTAPGRLNQTTPLEVIDHMTALQETALQRLYKWTSSQCRSIESLSPTTSSLLTTAMKHLQTKPTMFKSVLDEYCASRRALLVRSFLDALTVGGPGGTPRPIEMHAHDPQRYIGDMLAWLHQAIPSENENMKTLLKECRGGGGGGSEEIDIEKAFSESTSSITDDVCRPLKSRVEQILLLESAPIVLYKLTNLIRFYATTVKQQQHVASGLVSALEDLEQLAYTQFISVLQTTVQSQIARSTDGHTLAAALAHDLAPTPSTMALLMLLRETLSGSSVVDERPEQLQEIVGAIADPLMESLQSLAAPFPTTDRDVFLLNSLYQIHLTLSLFQSNDARLASLASEIQLHLDTLASEQTSCLIANLGLQPVCSMVADFERRRKEESGLSLAQMSGMDQATLKEFLVKFDGFLVAPDVFLLPQSRLLVSSAHRKSITRRSLEVVAASYAQLYQAVTGEGSGYVDAATLMPKTPEQVQLLLQL